MSIGAFVTVFALAILLKVSAFHSFVIGTTTTSILTIWFLHIVLLVKTTSSAAIVLVTTSLIRVSSSAHSSHSSSTTSKSSTTTAIHLLHASSTTTSSTVCLHIAILLLNWFECYSKLFCRHGIFGFSEFFITMRKMTSLSKSTITMLIKMSASFGLVLLIDLVLLLLSNTVHSHALRLSHSTHHVWELAWLIKPANSLAILSATWLRHHVALSFLHQWTAHHIVLLPLWVLHHMTWHLLSTHHATLAHAIHWGIGRAAHHHVVWRHALLIVLHYFKIL